MENTEIIWKNRERLLKYNQLKSRIKDLEYMIKNDEPHHPRALDIMIVDALSMLSDIVDNLKFGE